MQAIPDKSDKSHPAGRRRGKLGFIRMGVLTLIAAIAVYAVVAMAAKDKPGGDEGEKAVETMLDPGKAQFWTVKRGPLTISLLVPGTIKTRNTTSVVNMIEEASKILWVIPEGTRVKRGDKLVELEAPGLDDEIYDQRADLLRSEADYNNAMQELKLQEQDNKSLLITGRNAVEVAELELKKYKEGTSQQDQMTKETDITLADLELQRAQEKSGWTKKLLEKGYVSSGELKTDELEVKKNEIDLAKAKNALAVFQAYEVKSEELKLVKDLLEAQAELERTQQDNLYKLKSKQIAVETAQAEVDHEKSRLNEQLKQQEATVLKAPQDGMVVYASAGDRWNNTVIEVGAELRNRQRIIELPDFSAWQVEARVHESVIQQVHTSLTALVSVDAFNGVTLRGEVSRISVMPDSGGRWSADVKEYIVYVQLTDSGLPLKPGMTSKNEIILDELKDVFYVPIQAVSAQGKSTWVMVKNASGGVDRRPVKVGKANDRFVSINSGLKEGEEVMLLAQSSGISGLMQRPSNQRDGKGEKARERRADDSGTPEAAPAGDGGGRSEERKGALKSSTDEDTGAKRRKAAETTTAPEESKPQG